MINLEKYEAYVRSLGERISGIRRVEPGTFDTDMASIVQGLGANDLPCLFFIIPNSQGQSLDVDNIEEDNLCVLLLVDKTDPQRGKKSYTVQKSLQPVMEEIKQTILSDKTSGCGLMESLDLRSMSTVAESGVFNVLAGWSLAFNISSE